MENILDFLQSFSPFILLTLAPLAVVEGLVFAICFVWKRGKHPLAKVLLSVLSAGVAACILYLDYLLYIHLLVTQEMDLAYTAMAVSVMTSTFIINPLLCVFSFVVGIISVIICRKKKKPIVLPLCLAFAPSVAYIAYMLTKLP
jgi:hypothetical protein